MYSFLYLSFSINIVFSYVDLSSTIMYIVFVDFNKSSFQKKIKKYLILHTTHVVDVRKGIRSKNAATILFINTPGKGVL